MSPECLKGTHYDEKVINQAISNCTHLRRNYIFFQSDMFSFGIVLCELIGETDADPDVLPRTENFGVDYIAFTHLVSQDPSKSPPPEFLKLAFNCVQIEPSSRPSWQEIIETLDQITESKSQVPRRSPLPPLKMTKDHVPKKSNPPTPCVEVGREMSLLDPHYIPSPGTKWQNPTLSKNGLTFKILGPGQVNPFSELRIKLSGKIHEKGNNLWYNS